MTLHKYCAGLSVLVGIGCDIQGEDASFHTPFDFEGPALHIRTLESEDVDAIAKAALQADETLAWAGSLDLPGIGDTVVLAAAQDADDVSRGFAVLSDGSVLPNEELRDREQARAYERFGKLSPELFELQAGLEDDDVISIAIMVRGEWVNYSPTDLGTDPIVSAEDLKEYIAWHRATQRERIISAKKPVRDLMASAGVPESEDLEGIPMIVVSSPVWFLRSKVLNENSAVSSIFASISATDSELLGYAGQGSMNESVLTGGGCGGDCDGGAGAFDVGIWERTDETNLNSGVAYGGVANYHPRYWSTMNVNMKVAASACVQNTDCGTSGQRCHGGFCRGEHVSDVVANVGIVGSYVYGGTGSPSDPTPNAPGNVTFPSSGAWAIDVAVANQITGNAELDNINWLLNSHQGIYINRSASGLSQSGATVTDWAARTNGTVFTYANGNDVNIESCKNVWNGLCVGFYAYNTFDQTSTHRWFQGAGAVGSTYLNPAASPLYERPHLMGPGGHQDATSSISGLHLPDIENTSMMTRLHLGAAGEIYGSSFASPQVLSAAITATQYEGYFSALAFPVTTKAVLLASAVDSNADGAIGTGDVWSHGSGVDYKDGAGQIWFTHVKSILDNNNYAYRQLTDASFVSCGTGCREYTVATVTVLFGKHLKAALVWNACGDGVHQPLMNNDFDLYVVRPASCGGALQSNAGLTSEIEMVRESTCTPFPSGQWTIKVRIKNGATLALCYAETTEPIGVAWSQQ